MAKNLKAALEAGGYTALTVPEIVTHFNLDKDPANFPYVLNCLDYIINCMLHVDPQAVVDPWKKRRDDIWAKFPNYHELYENSLRTPPPIE